VVANFPGNKLPGYLHSVRDQIDLAIRTAARLAPSSKNRELAKFDANVITLMRLTLYHRNLSSMKNTVSVISTVLLFSCATLFQAKAATIDLPLYGFQIDALEAAPDASAPATALEMFLPPTESFAPNINVQIQPYTGTIKEYATLSKGQFDELKWKVISEKEIGDNEWSVEYTGTMQAGDLHFYARAISQNGKVYLATATAKESQWPTVSDTLRQHIDSFKVK